ncbi:MAG TPA: C4-dicarboxylate ABC transporter substrate-binding protein, partial [Burkholderiaceae bacterium]|nr:C4-dicarboxylate ABC transporter substrate-binding protein [Burkholderiaceae bacterium]
QQKAIRDGMDAAIRYQRERAKLQETDSLATIRQRGTTYDEASPKLIADMRSATAGIVDDVKKRAGEDLVKRVLAEAAKP